MAHDETALRNALELAAWAIAAAGTGLLLLACSAEIVRRIRADSRLVVLTDRLLPTVTRRIAVALVTLLSAATAVVVPAGAHGDDHLRSWLTDEPTTTTTSTVTPSTSPPTTRPPSTTTTTTLSPAPVAASPAAPLAAPRPAPIVRPREAPPVATAPAPQVAPVVPPPSAPNGATHTVVAGECLWSIAQRALGGHASARAVDRAWRAVYAANRDAIGTDPNLIHPGLVLVLPPLDPTP